MTEGKLFVGAETIVMIDRLREGHDGSFVNDAELTCTIYEMSIVAGVFTRGEPVDQADSLPMQYVVYSNGQYTAGIPSSAPLVVNRRYWLEVSGGGGFTRFAVVRAVRP